mmetsp:Transcript_24510/g.44433  ORF Transcript_24510/g.44433 Transcript_24510/m.44433 type:complete len:392 (-) Transcript_24510:197-1372(-)
MVRRERRRGGKGQFTSVGPERGDGGDHRRQGVEAVVAGLVPKILPEVALSPKLLCGLVLAQPLHLPHHVLQVPCPVVYELVGSDRLGPECALHAAGRAKAVRIRFSRHLGQHHRLPRVLVVEHPQAGDLQPAGTETGGHHRILVLELELGDVCPGRSGLELGLGLCQLCLFVQVPAAESQLAALWEEVGVGKRGPELGMQRRGAQQERISGDIESPVTVQDVRERNAVAGGDRLHFVLDVPEEGGPLQLCWGHVRPELGLPVWAPDVLQVEAPIQGEGHPLAHVPANQLSALKRDRQRHHERPKAGAAPGCVLVAAEEAPGPIDIDFVQLSSDRLGVWDKVPADFVHELRMGIGIEIRCELVGPELARQPDGGVHDRLRAVPERRRGGELQ